MDKDALAKSILLIGPAGVGKSLIASRLHETTGYKVIDLDALETYANNYYNGLSYSRDPLGVLLQDMRLIRASNAVMNNAKLTRSQKRLRKSFMHKLYREQKFYSKLCGGLETYEETITNYLKLNHQIPQDATYLGLLHTLNYFMDILQPVLKRIKEPVILDASGLSFIDLSNHYDELVGVAACYPKEKVEAALAKIKNTALLFGTRVCFKPGADYQKRLCALEESSMVYNELAKHMDGYQKLANLSIVTDGLFTDPTSSAFSTRNRMDFIKAEQRQGLINHKTIDSICQKIMAEREQNINSSLGDEQ